MREMKTKQKERKPNMLERRQHPHLLPLIPCSRTWLVAINYILVILARKRHCVDIMKYRWSSARAVLLDEEGEIGVREELVA